MSVSLTIAAPRTQGPAPSAPYRRWDTADTADKCLRLDFYRTDCGYVLRFRGLADFDLTRDGTACIAHPAPDVPQTTLDHLFLNQVVPLALSQQGRFVLHASAVTLDGVAAAFVGHSGQGKSTLAASFATAGFSFLTDDGLQLQWQGDTCVALPSHPSIRLWEDSREALVAPGAAMAPTVSYTSKTRVLAGGSILYCNVPSTLRRVFFLGDGLADDVVITPVSSAQALHELLKHSFLLDVEEQAMLAWQFDEVARLAALPVFFRLDYPRRYDQLDRVRAAIIAHSSGPPVTSE